jgi:predicted secreted protein
VVGDGEKVFLQAADSKNPTGDVYKTPVGDTDRVFRAIFKSENLKILPGDYEVSISKAGLAYFEGAGIEYFIAMEGTSKFN